MPKAVIYARVSSREQEKAEQGFIPCKPPHGYKRIDKKQVKIDFEEAKFVLRAFNLYAECNISLENVCKQLREEGFVYKSYRYRITKPSLESMLKNVFYKGQILFNGKIYNGVHEAVIDERLFEKTQQAFKKDGKPLYKKLNDFMFSNIMKCNDCGCTIIAEIKKEKYIYYHCSWGKSKKNCSNKKYIRQEKLESHFKNIVN